MARYKLKDVSKNFMKTVKATSNKQVRENIFELFRRIILKTPVKKGIAKANWQIALAKSNSNILAYTGDPGGAANKAMNEGLQELAKMQFGSTVYIFNNLPYIVPLEHGSSKQAGNGMVQVALNELRTLFK